VMSKRLMLKMVNEGYVNRFDDPRMPSLAGMRRQMSMFTPLRN